MKYMTVQEAAKKWNLSDRRVRFLCSQGRIRGMIRQGRRYLIPDNTEKPEDERNRQNKMRKRRKYNDFTRLELLKSLVDEIPEAETLLKEEMLETFIVRFAKSIAQRDGAGFTEKETIKVLNNKVLEDYRLSDHLIVLAMNNSIQYILGCVRKNKTLTQNCIRTIHQFADIEHPFSNGKYRKNRLNNKNDGIQNNAKNTIESQLNDLLSINNQRKIEMHPVERITCFLLEFLEILPFEDANERVAYLVMEYDLLQNGYLPIVFSPKDEDERVAAFLEFQQTRRQDRMVRLIARKEEEALERFLASAQRKRKKAIHKQKVTDSISIQEI